MTLCKCVCIFLVSLFQYTASSQSFWLELCDRSVSRLHTHPQRREGSAISQPDQMTALAEQLNEYRRRMAARDADDDFADSIQRSLSDSSWATELLECIPPSETSSLRVVTEAVRVEDRGEDAEQRADFHEEELLQDPDFVDDIDQLLNEHRQHESDAELARTLDREWNQQFRSLPPPVAQNIIVPTSQDIRNLHDAQLEMERQAARRGISLEEYISQGTPPQAQPQPVFDPIGSLFGAFFGTNQPRNVFATTYEELVALGDRMGQGDRGATREELERIPSMTSQPDNVHACPICLGEFETGEELIILPGCLHKFHGSCGKDWLSIKKQCPVCRDSVDLRANS